MIRRTFLLLAVSLSLAPPALAQDDPVAVVRELYRVHGELSAKNKVLWDEPAQRDRFFSARLARLIARSKSLRSAGSFDFIYDGQDFKISALDFALIRTAGGRATVEARFKNFDDQKKLEYTLVRERGTWRVDEIRSREKPSWILSQILKP